jgi:hypothetical protein
MTFYCTLTSSKAIWNQRGNEYLTLFEGSVHYLLLVSCKIKETKHESRLNGGLYEMMPYWNFESGHLAIIVLLYIRPSVMEFSTCATGESNDKRRDAQYDTGCTAAEVPSRL